MVACRGARVVGRGHRGPAPVPRSARWRDRLATGGVAGPSNPPRRPPSPTPRSCRRRSAYCCHGDSAVVPGLRSASKHGSGRSGAWLGVPQRGLPGVRAAGCGGSRRDASCGRRRALAVQSEVATATELSPPAWGPPLVRVTDTLPEVLGDPDAVEPPGRPGQSFRSPVPCVIASGPGAVLPPSLPERRVPGGATAGRRRRGRGHSTMPGAGCRRVLPSGARRAVPMVHADSKSGVGPPACRPAAETRRKQESTTGLFVHLRRPPLSSGDLPPSMLLRSR
jgi:hypothetical protein